MQEKCNQQVTYPRSGGMAPTIAPTHVLTGCICFNGVYTNAYRTRLEAASPAAKPLACTNLANFFHVSSSVSFLQNSAAENAKKKSIIYYTKHREKARTFQANKAVPAAPTLIAHMAACAGLRRPDGRGRRIVLFILASFFISNT